MNQNLSSHMWPHLATILDSAALDDCKSVVNEIGKGGWGRSQRDVS